MKWYVVTGEVHGIFKIEVEATDSNDAVEVALGEAHTSIEDQYVEVVSVDEVRL